MYYFIGNFPWWLTSFFSFVQSSRRLEISIKPSLWGQLMPETGYLNKFIHSPRKSQLLVYRNEHMCILWCMFIDFASVLCSMLFLLSSDEETVGNVFINVSELVFLNSSLRSSTSPLFKLTFISVADPLRSVKPWQDQEYFLPLLSGNQVPFCLYSFNKLLCSVMAVIVGCSSSWEGEARHCLCAKRFCCSINQPKRHLCSQDV